MLLRNPSSTNHLERSCSFSVKSKRIPRQRCGAIFGRTHCCSSYTSAFAECFFYPVQGSHFGTKVSRFLLLPWKVSPPCTKIFSTRRGETPVFVFCSISEPRSILSRIPAFLPPVDMFHGPVPGSSHGPFLLCPSFRKRLVKMGRKEIISPPFSRTEQQIELDTFSRCQRPGPSLWPVPAGCVLL